MILRREKVRRRMATTEPPPAAGAGLKWESPVTFRASELAAGLAAAAVEGFQGVRMTSESDRRGVFYHVAFQREEKHENGVRTTAEGEREAARDGSGNAGRESPPVSEMRVPWGAEFENQ